jgi:hypothetical protein
MYIYHADGFYLRLSHQDRIIGKVFRYNTPEKLMKECEFFANVYMHAI